MGHVHRGLVIVACVVKRGCGLGHVISEPVIDFGLYTVVNRGYGLGHTHNVFSVCGVCFPYS